MLTVVQCKYWFSSNVHANNWLVSTKWLGTGDHYVQVVKIKKCSRKSFFSTRGRGRRNFFQTALAQKEAGYCTLILYWPKTRGIELSCDIHVCAELPLNKTVECGKV